MTVTILRANALALPLADSSVDLVVTSPPYFGLRSYQDGGEHYQGQIGSEATPAEFVDALTYRLAAEVAMPLTQDMSRQARMFEMFRVFIGEAKAADDLLSRAIMGSEEVIRKDPDNCEVRRHRHDNRLAMSMLARLDRMADSPPEGSDAALARVQQRIEAMAAIPVYPDPAVHE